MGARRGTISAVVGGLVLLTGCSPTRTPSYGWHGREPILAIYQGKTLHSEFPEAIPPASVRAAAERVLASRGYTITSSEATEDRTRVVARPPDSRLFHRVIVGSSLSRGGTRVALTIEPGGNETTARDMLESVLTLLGR